MCGGADHFRFDDKEGRGTWFCNQCGAGDGLKLIWEGVRRVGIRGCRKVNAVTGNLPPVAPEVVAAAEAGTEADRKAAAAQIVRMLEKTRPATGNAYLTRKGFPAWECLTLTTPHKTGGVAYRAGDVVVPLYDETGALVNLQLINAEGLKRTLKGGQVKGHAISSTGRNRPGKRLWIAEGYATALTVHHLTGETVMVALSSVNLLSLASPPVRNTRPVRLSSPPTVTWTAPARQSSSCRSRPVRALSPCRRCSVTGMMRWCWKGRRHAESHLWRHPPTGTKPVWHHERGGIYRHGRQRQGPAGAWALRRSAGRGCQRPASVPLWKRHLEKYPGRHFFTECGWFIPARTRPFSRRGESPQWWRPLKLIIPQQEAPARRLIGFATAYSIPKAACSARTANRTGCARCAMWISPRRWRGNAGTHAPNFWRWLDRAASGNPTKRNVILAALFMVLANRYDWQLFRSHRPGGSGEKYSRRNRHDAGRRG